MTSPAGGNDEIIRVVYQAVADYSQLIRETRRARTETATLKRDIDGLAGTTTATVKVTADTGQARTELARVLRDVLVKVKVTVDAVAANTELQRLLRDVTVKARVTVDAVAAQAELGRLLRDTVVKVKVTVDAAAARAEVRRTLGDSIVIAGKLIVDTAAARAEIARATRDATIKVRVLPDVSRISDLAGFFADKTVRVAVALDEAGITERFRALLAHLESLGPVDVEMRIHQSAFDRLEAMAERLERIRDQIQGGGGGPGDDNPTPTPDPTPGPTGGGGSKKSPVPEGLSSAAGLVLKFLPLIAAAVPAAAGLAAIVGIVAAGLLAAGAAAAVFAVGAVGAFAKVTAAVKAYEKSGTIAEGPLGQVVTAFEDLKTRYNALQKATEQPVFHVLSRGLQIAIDLLGKVQPLVTTVAAAVDGAMAQVQAALAGKGFDDFLAFVGRQGPAAIKGFTAGLLGMAGGVGRLLQTFEPFIAGFVDGFARAGAAFDQWAAGLGADTKFQEFLAYAAAQIPRVIDLIVNLVQAAVNLLQALAPMGSVFLSLISGALGFVAAIDPHVLALVLGAVLGLAAGIKALQIAIAVQEGFTAFKTFMGTLPGLLGRVVASLGAARAAMIALGSATVIGLAITAAVLAIQAMNSANDEAAEASKKAADAADTHRRAVQSLTDALLAQGGVATAKDRVAAYQDLDRDPVALPSKYDDSQLVDKTQIKTVAGYAGEAGVDPTTLAKARLGDADAIKATNAALATLKAQYKAAGDAAALLPKSDPKHLEAAQYYATADAIGNAADQMGSYSGVMDEASAAAKILKDIQDGVAAGTRNAAGQYLKAADAASALKKALQADFSSDASTVAYTKATAAADAYAQQVQAVKDAEDAQTAATRTAKRAQEDLTTARAAAVQRIRDVQRALRDLSLDERQAKLSAKESDTKLQQIIQSGGTADEIEQARIDNERAHNAVSDLEQDKNAKKTSLEKELKAGVDGNRALQDAITTNKNAQKALTVANTNMGVATGKLAELHLAFQTAAGALGLTEDQVKKLRTNMDKIKDKTVKVVLNTTDAEAKLRAVLQGQYTLQLMAAHPGWSMAKATAEALKMVPTVAGTGTSGTGTKWPSVSPANRADGGPVPGPVAGAVYGPGSGTSDQVATVLPVGGPANLSNGEHIVTDAEVKAAGGHGVIEAFRAGLRSGRPWAPAQRYATGGAAARQASWSATLPTFRAPVSVLAGVAPGYAAGGPVAAMRASGALIDRSVTVNVGTINNPVPEPASTSLYRQVRKAVEGEE